MVTLNHFLVLSGVHTAAVLFHWLVKKENLIGAMFTGVKRVPEAAVRERREALRGTPLRRAASREHASAYFASPLRAHSVSTSPNSPAIASSWRSRKRAIVAWSGRCWAARTRNATSSSHARSITREDRTPRA